MKQLKNWRQSLIIFICLLIMLPFAAPIASSYAQEAPTILEVVQADDTDYLPIEAAFHQVNATITHDDQYEIQQDDDQIVIDSKNYNIKLNDQELDIDESDFYSIDGVDYLSISLLKQLIDARLIVDDGRVEIRQQMPQAFTSGFEVNYLKNDIKHIVDGDGREQYLVPRGKEVPEELKEEMVIEYPIQDVFSASTTQVCLLRPIDEMDSVIAVTSEKDTWTIDQMVEQLDNGTTTFVGLDDAVDYELLQTLQPEIAFVYGGDSGQYELIEKLDELEIPYSVNNEYIEEEPMGRMEWIKFTAAYYDKEIEAENYFNQAVTNVDEVVELVKDADKPTIAWGTLFNGTVYAPGSDGYVAKMIELAGGTNELPNIKSNDNTLSMEEFYDKAKDAEIYMYSSSIDYMPNIESLLELEATFGDFKAVKDNQVWCYANNYWQSIDKTDQLIIELAAILHPELLDEVEVSHYEHLE